MFSCFSYFGYSLALSARHPILAKCPRRTRPTLQKRGSSPHNLGEKRSKACKRMKDWLILKSVYDRGHYFPRRCEVVYDALINLYPTRTKNLDTKYVDSIKNLRRGNNKKRDWNTINRRKKYMEYKAIKKANEPNYAIPLCDRRTPSWIATAY